jgi:plastocyanin
MRRAVAAAVGLALLGALLLGPGAGSLVRGARADAAECLWNRHSKRVVSHVRRHGRVRRLVRVKHWWTCDEAAAVAPVPIPAPPTPVPTQPEPEANRLGVKSQDQAGQFAYVLSRPSTRSGEVTVELNNQGEDPHNLNLQRQGGEGEPVLQIAKTLPSQHQAATFELPPGTYRLWCSLPTHDEKGMHATLVVEG